MANELKHKDAGTQLTQTEDNAVGRHIADGQTENDMFYFNGTYWIRATPTTIRALLSVEEGSTADQTGGEMVAALEALGESSRLSHTKLDDVTTSQHHTKYTNNQAVAAAKTVKLDELSTPTDVATLNSSTSAHGLLKKLDNTATNFMNGQGNWTSPAGVAGVGHITILPINYEAIVQGTWTLYVFTDQVLNHVWYNSTAAINDEINYKVYLAKGTYTLRMLGRTYDSAGIMDVQIDGGSIASFDWWTLANIPNVMKSDTGNVIATPGLKTLTLKISAKNAEAAAYGCNVSYIALWRTA